MLTRVLTFHYFTDIPVITVVYQNLPLPSLSLPCEHHVTEDSPTRCVGQLGLDGRGCSLVLNVHCRAVGDCPNTMTPGVVSGQHPWAVRHSDAHPSLL